MKNNNTRFIPFLLAICLIAGIAIGTFYANHFSGNNLGIINTSSNKVECVVAHHRRPICRYGKHGRTGGRSHAADSFGTRPAFFLYSGQGPGSL